MDAAWPRRLRWRRRGAWMWPVFGAVTCADALIGTQLPPSGESETLVAAGLAGLVLNVLGVILLSAPIGALLRRRRPDLPRVVARDYAGTTVVLLVALALLAAGLIHRQRIESDQRAMNDAVVRAQAYIGMHAPTDFRRQVVFMNVFAIQPGNLFRACVPSIRDSRTYCVIVDTRLPFGRSVTFSGYEPNSILFEGTG